MEQMVQLKTWTFGLDWLGSEIGWEFWLIGGEPGEQQFVVGQVADHGLPLIFDVWLGQLKDCFGMDEIGVIKIASCDRLQIGRLVSSLDRDVAYPRLEESERIMFGAGG